VRHPPDSDETSADATPPFISNLEWRWKQRRASRATDDPTHMIVVLEGPGITKYIHDDKDKRLTSCSYLHVDRASHRVYEAW
jgi:hypothetical protein